MIKLIENPKGQKIKELAGLTYKTKWWDEVFKRPGSPVIDWESHIISQRQFFREMFKTDFDIEFLIFFKEGLLVSKLDDDRINDFLLGKFNRDKKYLFEFCQKMERDCNNFIDKMEKINKENYPSIIQYFKMRNYVTTYFRLVFNAVCVVEPMVYKEISSPLKMNFISQYNQELDNIKKSIKKQKEIVKLLEEKKFKNAIKELNQHKELKTQVNDFLRNYYWVKVFHHLGEYITAEDLLREISQSFNVRFVREDYKSINEDVELLRYLIFLRTYVAETNAYCSALLKPTLTKLAKEYNLEHDELVFLTQKEIVNLIKNKELPVSKDVIYQRKNGYAVILLKNSEYFIYGNSLKLLYKHYDVLSGEKKPKIEDHQGIIKGSVANKGFAKGIAKIINSAEDFDKFDKGEILVTSMTTPNYVPIIGKAAAIITDEGGITCHAAIVSRELGIPCIIGTKIATKVLKDGDMVEVDANKGVVKILK